MSDSAVGTPDRPRRIVMLDAKGPNNPPLGADSCRVVPLAARERFAILSEAAPHSGPAGAGDRSRLDPTHSQLASLVVGGRITLADALRHLRQGSAVPFEIRRFIDELVRGAAEQFIVGRGTADVVDDVRRLIDLLREAETELQRA